MNSPHRRHLQAHELRLVAAFASGSFAGSEQLTRQLTDPETTVHIIDDEGSLAVNVQRHLEPIRTSERVPVEAVAIDRDGMSIRALLHVVDGYATEIEILRDDGERIRAQPSELEWRLENWE
jgi:hypothetical protein